MSQVRQMPAPPPARVPVPDLLDLEPRLRLDDVAIDELMEISFLGGGAADHLEEALSRPGSAADSGWQPDLFREELFLDALVEECFQIESFGRPIPINRVFLREILCRPPLDAETVRFRQQLLTELDTDAEVVATTESLFHDLFHLLALFKAPHRRAKLDVTLFRLEILEQAKKTVAAMAASFQDSKSGLRRIHQTGLEIQKTREWGLLISLLDYENHLARVDFTIQLGADGKIRQLELNRLQENTENPFYVPPTRRLRDRIELIRHGFEFSGKELVNRVVHQVFLEISDWVKPLLQLQCHLAFYLGSRAFRQRSETAGLRICLPEFSDGDRLRLDGLFNPLLFRQGTPVPSDLEAERSDSIFVITGPNSGGKTRLLQAVGLAQILGQSGLYVPAIRANLPIVDGLFASATERASVDQREGRLGTELLRIRRLFESLGPRSMVLVDELCSGTNPSEAVEIFLMVIQLLQRVEPVGLITTHFLDFARELAADPPSENLQFLQVEMDGETSTYQFIPGVAQTSLATATARRLGVTLDELEDLVDRRHRPAS
ncbi:MAG: DNA mismatch repair protein [Thermoanaerobaculia bacterium]